jgi:hypothetical protein
MSLIWLFACTNAPDPDTEQPGDTTDTVDTQPPACSDALGTLPEGLTELSYYWPDSDGTTLDGRLNASFDDYQVNESVGFELTEPAVIHGFKVRWRDFDADNPEQPLTAALHANFGWNGFDFWPHDTLWEGTICVQDLDDEWATYVLDSPIEVPQPELIYVSHTLGVDRAPAWVMDKNANGDGACAGFDECHSAWNFPEVTVSNNTSFWNGLTYASPYDYHAALLVEYGDVAPDLVFEPLQSDLPLSSRFAWGDYDNDGWDDLLSAGRLFHNDAGTLVEVEGALSGVSASGGVWGDYDGDQCLDLLVFSESTRAGDTLLRGDCNGGFTDTTDTAGISDVQTYNLCESDEDQNHAPSPAAAWWDLDDDGDLDLYVVGFICWADWDFYRDQVFENNGDGTFTELGSDAGFLTAAYSGRGASPADADGDGDVDLFVNDYTLHRNLYYRNNGDGTVSEDARGTGLAGHEDSGYYGHSIGAAWGDLDGDGDLDVVEANLAHPRFWDFSDKTRILLNDGSGDFTDAQGDWAVPAGDAGVRFQETHSVPVLADFDHDGHLDLAISAVYDGRPTDFYWGDGDGTFTLDVAGAGITVENGWGMATADVDNDGDPDLAAKGQLFGNTWGDAHWVQVRAVGDVASNWTALGATVTVSAGGDQWVRHVAGGSGQGCQDSATVHVGLGDTDQIDQIEVHFPGETGSVVYTGPWDADQRIWLFESGGAVEGWVPPQ